MYLHALLVKLPISILHFFLL